MNKPKVNKVFTTITNIHWDGEYIVVKTLGNTLHFSHSDFEYLSNLDSNELHDMIFNNDKLLPRKCVIHYIGDELNSLNVCSLCIG